MYMNYDEYQRNKIGGWLIIGAIIAGIGFIIWCIKHV